MISIIGVQVNDPAFVSFAYDLGACLSGVE